jgi:hypothetical protein
VAQVFACYGFCSEFLPWELLPVEWGICPSRPNSTQRQSHRPQARCLLLRRRALRRNLGSRRNPLGARHPAADGDLRPAAPDPQGTACSWHQRRALVPLALIILRSASAFSRVSHRVSSRSSGLRGSTCRREKLAGDGCDGRLTVNHNLRVKISHNICYVYMKGVLQEPIKHKSQGLIDWESQ